MRSAFSDILVLSVCMCMSVHDDFKQGLENREKNNGPGKLREFYVWAKSQGIFLILGKNQGIFFSRMALCRDFYKIFKISRNL